MLNQALEPGLELLLLHHHGACYIMQWDLAAASGSTGTTYCFKHDLLMYNMCPSTFRNPTCAGIKRIDIQISRGKIRRSSTIPSTGMKSGIRSIGLRA